jgi:hypothetical protein
MSAHRLPRPSPTRKNVEPKFALGTIRFTQGMLADVELNCREHGNYPPTDPDGLRPPAGPWS